MATTLAQYVGGGQIVADTAFIADCEKEAAALLAEHIGDVTTVPADIKARALLEIGANLYHRKQTSNGMAVMENGEMSTIRVARDPLRPVYDMLRPFLGPGIG